MNLKMIDELRVKKPLVHHITNNVTVNECANIILNLGALPVMSYAPEEVAEMVQAAGALVLNIGTLAKEQIESMIIAGKKANELGIPVVLDPVGTGATSMRTKSTVRLMNEINFSAIKGNPAEISIIAGHSAEIKGVESISVSENMNEIAAELAQKTSSVIIVSGAKDILTNGNDTYILCNGHEYMGRLVGTGCMAASVTGAFLALKHDPLESAVCGLASYEIAAEIAAVNSAVKGPGSFKGALMDEAEKLNGETVSRMAKVEKI